MPRRQSGLTHGALGAATGRQSAANGFQIVLSSRTSALLA